MNTLSERAKILLDLAGGSLKGLAAIAGVKSPSVSDWLNGKTKAMKGTPAARIAKHFDINMLWITDGIGPFRNKPPALIQLSDDPQPTGVLEPAPVPYPGAIMVYGEEKLIVQGYRKLSEDMRKMWLQVAKDALEKKDETPVDHRKQA
jgi:transcriptional regulator with XRE-family HTH domain